MLSNEVLATEDQKYKQIFVASCRITEYRFSSSCIKCVSSYGPSLFMQCVSTRQYSFQSISSLAQICTIFNKQLQYSSWTVFLNILKIQMAVFFFFPQHDILTVMLLNIIIVLQCPKCSGWRCDTVFFADCACIPRTCCKDGIQDCADWGDENLCEQKLFFKLLFRKD